MCRLMEKVYKENIPEGEYCACRIPGMVLTQRGTLLAYYECRSSLSDWAQIDLKVIRSTDRGETWQTVEILPGGGDTLNNPVMIVEGETIHFLFCRNYKRLYACKSNDDGLSFTAPREITEVFDREGFFYNVFAVGPGHGIVHQGRLLVPVWIGYNREQPKAHWPSYVRTLYSDDGGESWQLGEEIGRDVLNNPSECALAVTKEGRVMISMRNMNEIHQRAVAFSDSGIADWQELHFEENLPDPVCMGSMTHTQDEIFHINCENQEKRTGLVIKISHDGMKTCERIPVDPIGGYSDLAVDGDQIYVLYERDIKQDGIYFKRITRTKE